MRGPKLERGGEDGGESASDFLGAAAPEESQVCMLACQLLRKENSAAPMRQ